MLFRKLSFVLFVVATIVLASCSGKPGMISAPDLSVKQGTDKPIGTLVSDRLPDGQPSSGYGFLGLYSVNVDPLTLKGELTPLR